MAEYQAPMAEKLRKSVGNVTYYIMHGKTFARAKVAHVKNAKTPKQLRHRATFTMLVQLARVLIETTRTGFPESEGAFLVERVRESKQKLRGSG